MIEGMKIEDPSADPRFGLFEGVREQIDQARRYGISDEEIAKILTALEKELSPKNQKEDG